MISGTAMLNGIPNFWISYFEFDILYSTSFRFVPLWVTDSSFMQMHKRRSTERACMCKYALKQWHGRPFLRVWATVCVYLHLHEHVHSSCPLCTAGNLVSELLCVIYSSHKSYFIDTERDSEILEDSVRFFLLIPPRLEWAKIVIFAVIGSAPESIRQRLIVKLFYFIHK